MNLSAGNGACCICTILEWLRISGVLDGAEKIIKLCHYSFYVASWVSKSECQIVNRDVGPRVTWCVPFQWMVCKWLVSISIFEWLRRSIFREIEKQLFRCINPKRPKPFVFYLHRFFDLRHILRKYKGYGTETSKSSSKWRLTRIWPKYHRSSA